MALSVETVTLMVAGIVQTDHLISGCLRSQCCQAGMWCGLLAS